MQHDYVELEYKYEPYGYAIVVPKAWLQCDKDTLRCVILSLLSRTDLKELFSNSAGMYSNGLMTKLTFENDTIIFKVFKDMNTSENWESITE